MKVLKSQDGAILPLLWRLIFIYVPMNVNPGFVILNSRNMF